jgi:hypothetical protein
MGLVEVSKTSATCCDSLSFCGPSNQFNARMFASGVMLSSEGHRPSLSGLTCGQDRDRTMQSIEARSIVWCERLPGLGAHLTARHSVVKELASIGPCVIAEIKLGGCLV